MTKKKPTVMIGNTAYRTGTPPKPVKKTGDKMKDLLNKMPNNITVSYVFKNKKDKKGRVTRLVKYSKDEHIKPFKGCQGIAIAWSLQGRGFGEICIYQEDGKIKIDSECESREFVVGVLYHLVKRAEFTDPVKDLK